MLASDNLPKGFRSWPGSHLADAAPVTTAVGTWSMYGQAAFFASKGGASLPRRVPWGPDWPPNLLLVVHTHRRRRQARRQRC